MKDRQAKKQLAASLYSLKKGWDFKNISDTGFPTACHKVSCEGYSSELGIKAILLWALFMHFLLTKLFPGLSNSGHFCDMTNYTLKPLTILEIHRITIKETYVWFEILKQNLYLLDV